MEKESNNDRINYILDKLEKGLKFGLFEDGHKCYFEDGSRVAYQDLWTAVKLKYELSDDRAQQSLYQICKGSFMGIFSEKFSKKRFQNRNS